MKKFGKLKSLKKKIKTLRRILGSKDKIIIKGEILESENPQYWR